MFLVYLLFLLMSKQGMTLHWLRERDGCIEVYTMGKQGSLRCARPILQNTNSLFRTKDFHFRSSSDSLGASTDPSIGRRILGGDNYWNSKVVLLHGFKDDSGKFTPCKSVYVGKKHTWFRRHVKPIAFMLVLMAFLLLLDSLMVSIFGSINPQGSSPTVTSDAREVGLLFAI